MEAKISFLERYKKKKIQQPPLSSDGQSSSNWINLMKGTLHDVREMPLNLSIYKVPEKLRKVNEDAYSPRIVSIGPFHQGKPDLLAMEEHKWRYMLYFLQRTPTKTESHKCLEDCGNAISKLGEIARGFYAENNEFKPGALAEIMLLDGCFILELLFRYSGLLFNTDNSDPIFDNAWMVPTLRHDLALLENQIPFFILERLYDIAVPLIPEDERPTRSITDLALSFFHPYLDPEAIRKKCSEGMRGRHLLDLLHNFYLPTSKMDPVEHKIVIGPSDQKETRGFRKCATKLSWAGIEFGKGPVDHLLDITFNKADAVINIPPLHLLETTESLLRNLIAYEQCSLDSTHHITSYAILMKSLIKSPSDIKLLQRNNIIINNLGGVKDAVTLFNNISREVAQKDFHFGELCEEVLEYEMSWCHWLIHKAFWKVRWNRYTAALKRDYFSNPWRIIAFIVAVVLLILTGLQTFYTVRSYYPH